MCIEMIQDFTLYPRHVEDIAAVFPEEEFPTNSTELFHLKELYYRTLESQFYELKELADSENKKLHNREVTLECIGVSTAAALAAAGIGAMAFGLTFANPILFGLGALGVIAVASFYAATLTARTSSAVHQEAKAYQHKIKLLNFIINPEGQARFDTFFTPRFDAHEKRQNISLNDVHFQRRDISRAWADFRAAALGITGTAVSLAVILPILKTVTIASIPAYVISLSIMVLPFVFPVIAGLMLLNNNFRTRRELLEDRDQNFKQETHNASVAELICSPTPSRSAKALPSALRAPA